MSWVLYRAVIREEGVASRIELLAARGIVEAAAGAATLAEDSAPLTVDVISWVVEIESVLTVEEISRLWRIEFADGRAPIYIVSPSMRVLADHVEEIYEVPILIAAHPVDGLAQVRVVPLSRVTGFSALTEGSCS